MSQTQPTINKAPARKRSLVDQLRRTEVYELWKRAVFIRDRFTCQQCGRRNGKKPIIEAHHLIEFSDLVKKSGAQTIEEGINNPSLWEVSNGQTLCHDCHKETDSYPKGLSCGKEAKRSMDWRYKPNKQKDEQHNGDPLN